MMTTDNGCIINDSVTEIPDKKVFDDTSSSASEKCERLFTQAELEKCIGERLMRERRNNASLESIKKLIDSLSERGVISADSYAQAEAEICEKLSLFDAGNTRLSDSAESNANSKASFNNEAITKEDAKPIAESNADESAGTDEPCEDAGDVCEESGVSDFLKLCECYPDIDAESLIKSAPFIAYCRGRSGTLCELYRGYSSLVEALESFRCESSGTAKCIPEEAENAFRRDRHAVGALSSTGFSQRSASEASDFASMLSPAQRSIAKRAGISYSEYALLLRDIPDSSKIKKQR